jgi:PAS domain S-box-containing protein
MDYRAILDNAPVPILVIQDARVVYCNASGYEVFRYCGYDVDESSIGDFDFMAMVPEAERAEAQQSIAKLLAGQSAIRNIPRTLQDTDGNPIQTLTSASIVSWKGRPAYQVSYLIVGLYPVLREMPPLRHGAVSAPTPTPTPTTPSLRDARQQAIEPLTPQERRIALAIADGQSTAQIRQRLSIRDSTLRGYIKSVYRKLGVHSRTELVRLLLGHR